MGGETYQGENQPRREKSSGCQQPGNRLGPGYLRGEMVGTQRFPIRLSGALTFYLGVPADDSSPLSGKLQAGVIRGVKRIGPSVTGRPISAAMATNIP